MALSDGTLDRAPKFQKLDLACQSMSCSESALLALACLLKEIASKAIAWDIF
jgi:hypothetical protein